MPGRRKKKARFSFLYYGAHDATKIKLYFAFKESFQAQFMERCRLCCFFGAPLEPP